MNSNSVFNINSGKTFHEVKTIKLGHYCLWKAYTLHLMENKYIKKSGSLEESVENLK